MTRKPVDLTGASTTPWDTLSPKVLTKIIIYQLDMGAVEILTIPIARLLQPQTLQSFNTDLKQSLREHLKCEGSKAT